MEGIDVNGKFFKITKHAAHRAAKRKITHKDIKEVLVSPKSIRATNRVPEEETVYSYLGHNGIILIVNYRQDTIITLMRRNKNYAKARSKSIKNKRQLDLKRRYGNRLKL